MYVCMISYWFSCGAYLSSCDKTVSYQLRGCDILRLNDVCYNNEHSSNNLFSCTLHAGHYFSKLLFNCLQRRSQIWNHKWSLHVKVGCLVSPVKRESFGLKLLGSRALYLYRFGESLPRRPFFPLCTLYSHVSSASKTIRFKSAALWNFSQGTSSLKKAPNIMPFLGENKQTDGLVVT